MPWVCWHCEAGRRLLEVGVGVGVVGSGFVKFFAVDNCGHES